MTMGSYSVRRNIWMMVHPSWTRLSLGNNCTTKFVIECECNECQQVMATYSRHGWISSSFLKNEASPLKECKVRQAFLKNKLDQCDKNCSVREVGGTAISWNTKRRVPPTLLLILWKTVEKGFIIHWHVFEWSKLYAIYEDTIAS